MRICFDNTLSKSLYMFLKKKKKGLYMFNATRFYCFKKLNRVKKKIFLIPIQAQSLWIGLSKFKAQNSVSKHNPILIGLPEITCGQKGNLGLAIRVLGFAHIYSRTLFHFVPSRLVSLCTSLLIRSNGARCFLPQLYVLSFSEISFRSGIWFRVYYFIS